MSDFEEIQRIIRLKRHELPPPDFVEDFVARLQDRQRAELLNQSARGLLWERLSSYFEGLLTPRWGFAGATAVVAAAAVFFAFKPSSQTASGNGFQISGVDMAEGVEPISQEEVARYLSVEKLRMGRHYQGGLADEQSGIAGDYSLQSQNGLLPAGLQMDVDFR